MAELLIEIWPRAAIERTAAGQTATGGSSRAARRAAAEREARLPERDRALGPSSGYPYASTHFFNKQLFYTYGMSYILIAGHWVLQSCLPQKDSFRVR